MTHAGSPAPHVSVRADRLLPSNLERELLVGYRVDPHWIDGTDRFWFLGSAPDGAAPMLVDPEAGSVSPVFDVGQALTTLSEVVGRTVRREEVDLARIRVSGSGVSLELDGAYWGFEPDGRGCRRIASTLPPTIHELVSPDGRWGLSLDGHDLQVRDLRDGSLRRLTDGGVRDFAYGVTADQGMPEPESVEMGAPVLPVASWSPDSTTVVTVHLDQRHVPEMRIPASGRMDAGRPVMHTLRYAVPGDPLAHAHLVLIDVATAMQRRVDGPPLETAYQLPMQQGRVWWSSDGARVFLIRADRGDKRLLLQAIDARTGRLSTVLEETGRTHVDAEPLMEDSRLGANVRPVDDGDAFVWWSERDGWGHLYLVDGASGQVRQPITGGEWVVRELLHVDEAERTVTFTASGKEPGDPYLRRLYRVGLDGRGLELLEDEPADHFVTVSPSGRYLLDTYGDLASFTTTVIRRADGAPVLKVARTETERLTAAGWTAPERFVVKAADGLTDIWGTMFRPSGFDPSCRYPVLDDIYPGPQKPRAAPTIDSTFGPLGIGEAASYAELGFVVVTIDGRGTPFRSKAFHDHSYGDLGDAGLDDHVVALKQLGARYPFMDLERVGIYGHSAGGYATVRAMLRHPGVFKVGVASSGNHDQRANYAVWGEKYQGLVGEADYETQANAPLAAELRGRLLLIHGELDSNVTPYLTMQLVDALVAADKDFELLIVPGVGHRLWNATPYVTRRRREFLARHLIDGCDSK